MEVHLLPALSDNYIFMIPLSEHGEWACVDPAVSDVVISFLEKKSARLTAILNTHHHSDHVGGNLDLKARTGCEIYGHCLDSDRIPGIDNEVSDGDVIRLGSEEFKVMEVSAHTQGHIAYFMSERKKLFIGDTLFAMGCGRLFEGDAGQMVKAHKKITELPLETLIYCAHEYTLSNAEFALSVEAGNPDLASRYQHVLKARETGDYTVPFSLEQELKTNPFLRLNSKEIRSTLGVSENTDSTEVFSILRSRKDQF